MKDKCPFCGHDVAKSPFGHIWCDQCDYRLETDKFQRRPLEDSIQKEVNNLERRLINLTSAVEDFLNDVRERPAVDKLERAMNDYGMRE